MILREADGRMCVWRRQCERLGSTYIVQRDRYGGGNVLVWIGISNSGKTELKTIRDNLNRFIIVIY